MQPSNVGIGDAAGQTGLTSKEATQRLKEVGPNVPAGVKRTGPVLEFLSFFANPLVVILLLASIASAFLGEPVNAILIATIVLFSVVLNFIQSFRSQRAADELRAVVAPLAEVLRDGTWTTIHPRELVPGDVIHLDAGDLVPADARILDERDLHVQQAALTGESLPVEKSAVSGEPGAAITPDAPNYLFLGTSVVSGTALAEITVTGRATAFGDIAARLAARAPQTEFDRGLRHFGFLIMRTVFFLVLVVLMLNLARHRDPFESFLFALALAVGLTPEFLPMITTVTLGQGAIRMGRQKVIVKHLEAIQNFGSIDILCSDKTGTLTSGEMSFARSLDPVGEKSGYPLALGILNSRFQSGIESPLDVAILTQQQDNARDDYAKIDEIPFDFERRRLSVVVRSGTSRLLIAKGAPDGLIECCTRAEVDGARLPLDESLTARIRATNDELSEQGERVLGVAFREIPQQPAYDAHDEQDLVFAGFLAFDDPPLADAAGALQALRDDGVAVKVLTGDNERVAKHVCASVGIDPASILLGSDLDKIDDRALEHVAESTAIFARVSPAQKDRIIRALKQSGHVVGFLGDGVNDAPSLRTADVGISVMNAADIAKDAAAIILLERSLRVLHNGILEGRKAFGNVTKYLLMGTSSNFGNMFSMAGAPLLLPFLPMLPTQILLNNFLYDLAQITIPTDKVDPEFTRKPRRWNIRLIRNFMLFIGPISSIYDFLTFFVMLKLFHASETLFHTGWFVESLVTQTLVLFVIRTMGNPLRSRPSVPLTVTIVAILLVAVLLPFSPLAHLLGFTALPLGYFAFLLLAAATYLLIVEFAKRPLLRRYQE